MSASVAIRWSMATVPANSSIPLGFPSRLMNAEGTIASFFPDVAGLFVVVATLTDGCSMVSYNFVSPCDSRITG